VHAIVAAQNRLQQFLSYAQIDATALSHSRFASERNLKTEWPFQAILQIRSFAK
jgi:hypothetical protein